MSLLFARFVLVAVFCVAAVAKLSDRPGARLMAVEFGAPAAGAMPLAWALICCELGVAGALLFGPSAQPGGIAALSLLVAFGAAVAINVSRGRRPECHCFGNLHSRAVGWSTVARNALLATVAAFVATGGRLELGLAAGAVIAVGAWLALELRQSSGLRTGASAPPVALSDQQGRQWTLESLLSGGRGLLLVFSAPACGACQALMPEVARWQARPDTGLTVAVVSVGSPADQLPASSHHGLRTLLVDERHRVSAAYGITRTPSAVLIDVQGRIGAPPALGTDEITDLFGRTAAGDEHAHFARRAVLARGILGVAGITFVPFIDSAAAVARSVMQSMRPSKLKIDGAWICGQRYALCTSAPCKPSKTNPNISVCKCKVKTGYSVGFKSCEKREPTRRQLHSNFSLQEVTKRTRTLKCSERALWVQCLDVVCEWDPHNPRQAFCQCANMRTKDYYLFADKCDTKMCKSTIWSATTAPFPGGAQLEKGLKRLGISYRVPEGCPTAKRKS